MQRSLWFKSCTTCAGSCCERWYGEQPWKTCGSKRNWAKNWRCKSQLLQCWMVMFDINKMYFGNFGWYVLIFWAVRAFRAVRDMWFDLIDLSSKRTGVVSIGFQDVFCALLVGRWPLIARFDTLKLGWNQHQLVRSLGKLDACVFFYAGWLSVDLSFVSFFRGMSCFQHKAVR